MKEYENTEKIEGSPSRLTIKGRGGLENKRAKYNRRGSEGSKSSSIEMERVDENTEEEIFLDPQTGLLGYQGQSLDPLKDGTLSPPPPPPFWEGWRIKPTERTLRQWFDDENELNNHLKLYRDQLLRNEKELDEWEQNSANYLDGI